MKKWKRLISGMLSLLMIVSIFTDIPVYALATEDPGLPSDMEYVEPYVEPAVEPESVPVGEPGAGTPQETGGDAA